MAERSGITWTRSTFNPVIGCTKIGPGCDHCYAERLDEDRLSKTLGGASKEHPIVHWGWALRGTGRARRTGTRCSSGTDWHAVSERLAA